MKNFLLRLKEKYFGMAEQARASLWFMFADVVNKGVSFLTTPIFARILTEGEYGKVGLYNTWLILITIFATFELATGVYSRAMIKYEDDRDGYTSASLFLASVLTVVFFIFYLIFRKPINAFIGLDTVVMVLMFIDIFFNTAWSLYAIRNRFEYRYRSIVIITIIANAVATVVSLLFVLYVPIDKVQARVLGMVLVRASIYAVVYVLIFKRGKKAIVPEYWRYAIWYNTPLIPHYLSQQVLNQSDRIMINSICGEDDTGVYTLAYTLAVVMQIVTNAIAATFNPWSFQAMKEKKYKKIGVRALQIHILVGVICLLFSLFAPELIMILGGEKYMRAVYIVPPVCMSILFLTMYSFFGIIEFYYERTKSIMTASVVVALSNIVLNAIFIPIYGFVAAGYTTLVCYIFYAMIHYWIMKKIIREEKIEDPFSGRMMWGTSLFFAAASVGISLVYPYTIARYLLIVLITAAALWYFFKNKAVILGKN